MGAAAVEGGVVDRSMALALGIFCVGPGEGSHTVNK